MKNLLLAAGLLASLASCGTQDGDPTPTPTPVLAGHWVADAVYSKPLNDYANLYLVTYRSGQLELDGSTLTVTPGVLVGAATASATTSYSLTLPLLRYASQTTGAGAVDSFLHVTATSFGWHHYQYAPNPTPPSSYVGQLVVATFHR